MKKIILLKFVFIIIFYCNITNGSIKNNVIVNVGDQIITSFELKNKIKTLLFLSNQELSQKNINMNKSVAIKSLVGYKLKKKEILKYNVTTNKNAINNHLNKISSRLNTNVNQLRNIFNQNQINYEMFLEEVEIEFSWQTLIVQLYKEKISVDENSIKEELNNILLNNKKNVEYKLAEIELLLDSTEKYENKVIELQSQIQKIGFENAAIKFSTSPSGLDGGNLGWINSQSLSSEIYEILKKLKVGGVSEPILKANSITLIKLLDKKEVELNDADIEIVKKDIINRKQNELLNLYSNNHLSKLKNTTFIQFK